MTGKRRAGWRFLALNGLRHRNTQSGWCRWERRASPTEGFSGAQCLKMKVELLDLKARRKSLPVVDVNSSKAVIANQMLQFNAPVSSEVIPAEIAALHYRMVTAFCVVSGLR